MHRHPRAILIALAALLLAAACGGPAGEPTATPPTTQATPPSAPEITPTVPASPTPTQVPTAPPGPTVPAEPGAVSSGPCYHPYLPIHEGITWRYRMTHDQGTLDYASTYENVSEDAFTVLQTFDAITTAVGWSCTGEGLVSREYATINLASTSGFAVETVDYGGATLPPADEWAVGATWESHYEVSAFYTAQGAEAETRMTITIQSQIAAVEAVTVPAGAYDEAYRVDSTSTTVMRFGSGEGESTSTVESTSSAWYARDVGLVRQAPSGEGAGSFVIELVSIN